MYSPLLITYLLSLVTAFDHFVSINCGSYERTMVSTKYANYTSDSFFQGLASTPQAKQVVPDSVKNSADRELVKNHRTTNEGYNKFSYQPIIRENGNYLIIFTFIQSQFRSRGQRIFHIKLGEQIIHTVDIVEEAGYGKLLHKWIQFELRDDIIYINGTYPALNGFHFKTHQVRFLFQNVKEKAKIQGLLIVKGSDIKQFLDSFLLYEQQKNVMRKQYLADKYRKPISKNYRVLSSFDDLKERRSQSIQLLLRLFSLKSLGCVLCAIIAIHYENIAIQIKKQFSSKQTEKQKKQ